MAEDDLQLNKLKASLHNWREIILPVSSVLLWEKQWHPCALMGGSTILFTSIWLLDPSLLTAMSILGLTMTISDYTVPLLAASMLKADLWTEKKDKQFDIICNMILKYYNGFKKHINNFYEMRTSKPKLYYGCVIITLLLLAWIGNNINNLFLTYLFLTLFLLAPGMEYNGFLHIYSKMLTEKIGDMATSAKFKLGSTKKE